MVVIAGINSSGLQKVTEAACAMADMDIRQCTSINELLEAILHNNASVAVVELDFLGQEVGIFLHVAHRLYTSRQVIILAASAEEARNHGVEIGRGITQVFTQSPPAATLSAFLTKADQSMNKEVTTEHEATV
jgi:hypothetical protein